MTASSSERDAGAASPNGDADPQPPWQRRLAEAEAEAERAREELQDCLYAVSHDLQRPLRHARSFSQILARRCGDGLDEDTRKILDRIIAAGDEGTAMVEGLLKLSRVLTEGKPLEPTDSGEALARARSALATAISESGAEVTHGAMPHVMADPDQLRTVFHALLRNALRFSKDNTPPRIEISASPQDRLWHFAVKDNGVGIEEKHQARIFAIFQRPTARSNDPGLGLGLPLCQRIITRHRGRIWVESRPGEGSTFFFTLRDVETEG